MSPENKLFPVFSKKERDEWNSRMGRHYLESGNLWKKTDKKVDYELNIAEIGQSRIVSSKTSSGEFYTDPDYQNKNKPTILEEFYVSSGSIDVEFESKKFNLVTGDILIFDDASPPLRFKIKKPVHIIAVYMPIVLLKSWMPRSYDKLQHTLLSPGKKSTELLASYLTLLANYAVTENETPLVKSAVPLLMANISMLVFALSEMEDEKPKSIKESQLDLAKQYIMANIANSKIKPARVAEELGISVRYLHWLFKQTNETFTEFLTRKRIDLAQLLLASSSNDTFNVTEVAFMCGFNDSTHFSRRFKQQVGIPPSKFRKNRNP
ncbi:MAG: hypothetical protein CMM27_02075 [Rhodospirillaceae bacterium]|nr:hypothetical protein [Rhodospirillaceae bacterium]|tara:strand:- start:2827 stop:3792 length:966 start_codon:yes stop_codon:yes gene_type:complete